MSAISDLSSGIFQTEFDGDSGIVPESYITSWLNANLGQLNSLINTSYSGSGAALDLESSAIYKEMYLCSYYNKQSRNALRGILSTSNGGDVLSLRDGNSSVSFTNKNEVAKVYKSMATDCQTKIDVMSHKYNMYQSEPLQLGGIETSINLSY
jgi:hypothetical protein